MSKFKVGDEFERVVSDGNGIAAFTKGYRSIVAKVSDSYVRDENGFGHSKSCISLLQTGPVRTVTRKEIVPGRYGIVSVGDAVVVPDCNNPDSKPHSEINVSVGGFGMVMQTPYYTPTELRAAAATFNELADALDASQ